MLVDSERTVRVRHIQGDPPTQIVEYDDLFPPGQPLSVSAFQGAYAAPWNLEEVHAGMEVGVVLAGEKEFHYSHAALHTGPGDVWLVAPWEPHGTRFQPVPLERVVVAFLPEFLGEELLGGLSWLSLFAVPPLQRPRVTGEEVRQEVLALGRQLFREVCDQRLDWQNAVRLKLLNLLLVLRRGWDPPEALVARPDLYTSSLLRLQPAMVAVHADPARRTTAEQAAALCRFSPAQFRRVFHKTMGLSYREFRLRSRLVAASHLLSSTALSTDAIAERTGFADASHLHRAFTKQYGCTPASHRRRFQG